MSLLEKIELINEELDLMWKNLGIAYHGSYAAAVPIYIARRMLPKLDEQYELIKQYNREEYENANNR